MPKTHNEILIAELERKFMELSAELPQYIQNYLIAREGNSSIKTRIAYTYDLCGFLHWLNDSDAALMLPSIHEIPIEALAKVRGEDIDNYVIYLRYNGNKNAAIMRKKSAISSLYKYLIRKNYLEANPIMKSEPILDKSGIRIIRLQPNEITDFVDTVGGSKAVNNVSRRQQTELKKARDRDYAIIMMFLCTGIRVSECAGLNIQDLDLDNCTFEVIRKGGKRQKLAMSEELVSVMRDYLVYRSSLETADEDSIYALFLSSQHKRLGIRAYQNLIKKYAGIVGTKENITPHKLRKTYGTELYNATGDIFLVAQALGHNDVSTTKDHYVEETTDNLLKNKDVFQIHPERKK